MSTLLKEGLQTLHNGYKIVPILPNKKYPGIKDWQNIEANEAMVRGWAANGYSTGGVGVLASTCQAIDIDVLDKAVVLEALDKVASLMGVDDAGALLTRVGRAPKALVPFRVAGGSMTKRSSAKWVDVFGDKHQLEILGEGQQWVAWGVHPETGGDYLWRGGVERSVATVPLEDLPELTVDMVDALLVWFDSQAASVWGWEPVGAELVPTSDYAGGANSSRSESRPTDTIDSFEMQATLAYLDPSCGHDDWLKIGMGCYHGSAGEGWGFELWDDWSSAGDNYKEREMAKRWASFEPAVGVSADSVVSWGTVKHLVAVVRGDQGGGVVDDSVDADIMTALMQDIEHCGDVESLTGEVCGRIRAAGLNKVALVQLEHALGLQFKELSGGARLLMRDVRELTRGTYKGKERLEGDRVAPSWCNSWVYVNDRYYHVDRLTGVSVGSFNLQAGHCVPFIEDSEVKMTAARYVADGGYVQVLDSVQYLPWCADRIVEMEGVDVLNTYCHERVPIGVEYGSGELEEGDEGGEAVQAVSQHITAMLGEDEGTTMLLWMAWQVQHPGELLKWAPIVCGPQGVGKTIIENVMTAVMGYENVGTVSSKDVCSQFTGWGVGRAVNVIQELRIAGHNRHDAAETLKSMITDRVVNIINKGRDSYSARNTCNYICMTNHLDALPMTADDRRWWAVLAKRPDGADEDYYGVLFDAIDEQAGALRWWLEHLPIPEWFASKRIAPRSDIKDSMVATEVSKHQGRDEAVELLAEKGEGFCEEVFDSALFTLALNAKFAFSEELIGQKLTRLFTSMGYLRHPKVVKWKGKTRRFWCKGVLTSAQIRDLLK